MFNLTCTKLSAGKQGEIMSNVKLYYATNRKHEGNQWNPTGYGKKFSASGQHNLRFGVVNLEVDDNEISNYLNKKEDGHTGDGEGLAEYLTKQAKDKATFKAYKETLKDEMKYEKIPSTIVFKEIQTMMKKSSDILIYIHGYNVDWFEAVGSALALQFMMNRNNYDNNQKEIQVFLFSWPSDGSRKPFFAYWSDRNDAEQSGLAVGRAMLKLYYFFEWLHKKAHKNEESLCQHDIHLLCHSMGNYVLQNTLPKLFENNRNRRLPRLFKNIFLCAADVDDDVLEQGQSMDRLHEIALFISVYYNNKDIGMHLSDKTKGNPDRLGQSGFARGSFVHKKIHQIDCTDIVSDFVGHSYYLWAAVNDDIAMSINDLSFDGPIRMRVKENQNSWKMK